MRTPKRYIEIDLYVNKNVHMRLKRSAVEYGCSMQKIIRTALGEWFDRQERLGGPVPELRDEDQSPEAATIPRQTRQDALRSILGHPETQEVLE